MSNVRGRGGLTGCQVIEALGVPWVLRPEVGLQIDGPPTDEAAAAIVRGQYCVALMPRGPSRHAWLSACAHGIHEALHLVTGPSSLSDEGALMGYEQAVCLELLPEHYAVWRRMWSGYCLGSRDVGDMEDYLEDPEWLACVKEAKEAGFLDERGRPVWGAGVSARFNLTAEERRRSRRVSFTDDSFCDPAVFSAY